LFLGCAKSFKGIPKVTAKMAINYGVEEVTLARGRGIYMAHCASCHERVHPGEIDPEFWCGVISHMAVEAKLMKLEQQQLLHDLMVAHAEVHGLDSEH
jgi:hypothetical protein